MINSVIIKKDLKLIFRDPFIAFFAVLPFILEGIFQMTLRLDLINHLPIRISGFDSQVLLRSFLPYFGGMMGGWMTGFLILEEREEDLEILIKIAPCKKREVFYSRLLLTLCLSLSANAVLYLADLLFFPYNPLIFTIFLASSSIGPFTMILLDRFGKNRVQGLTICKFSSFILIPPILMLFLKDVSFWIFGILSPLSWFTRAFSTACRGENLFGTTAAGLAYMVTICLILKRD